MGVKVKWGSKVGNPLHTHTHVLTLGLQRNFKSLCPKLGTPKRIDRKALSSTLKTVPLKPKRIWVHLLGHKQLAWTYIATTSVASKKRRKFQNGSPKLVVAYIGNDDVDITLTPTFRA